MKKEKTSEKKKNQKPKKGVSLSTILLVLILIAGVGIMLYPTVSDYWNSFHQSRAITNYDDLVGTLEEQDYEAMFKDAQIYNSHLRELSYPFSQCGQLETEYHQVLDITGTGIIGYVTIRSIGVELPIYHGTSDAVLNIAAGHLEGSSLPIGGASTHSVISAHRGLPSAKLFTDLDKLEEGDTFTVTVLNQILTYEVDQILIVEPNQMEALQVVEGMDYVTLQTCTPYGINTHRLLVRGYRVETEEGAIAVHKDAIKIPAYIAAPAVAIPILFILLLILLIVQPGETAHVSTADLQDIIKKRDSGDDRPKQKK